MKQRTHLLIPLLAIAMLARPACRGAVVFSDNFSQAPGTAIVGESPTIGSAWTGNGNGVTVSSANSLDTSGLSIQVFGGFTAALGTGQIITLQYDTLAPAAGTFLVNNTSWGGISLFSGYTGGTSGTEEMFAGNPSAGFWGTDGTIGRYFGTDTNEISRATLTYAYDTGAWTFTTATGYTNSGTGPAHYALNALRVGDGSAYINVKDITVNISAVQFVTFAAVSPANGSYSGSRTSVSLQAIDGNAPVKASTIVMKVDGGTVTPAVTKSGNVTTIAYAPVSPLSAATLHTAQVTLADNNGTLYTNAWSFTTAFPSLPSVLPGPIVASNQEVGIIIFSTNDAWLGANYGPTSGNTIYARFSIEFDNLNGETGAGGGYGGLQFFEGGINGTPHLIAGNAWISTNWSVDPYPPGAQTDLAPLTPIVYHEWHTIVERVDYTPSGNSTVNVWLDPDFTLTEAAQTTPPTTISIVDTFDTIALRTGNGTTSATFSNIVLAATSAGAGFAAPAAPQFQNFVPAPNAPSAYVNSPISVQVAFGTYGIGTQTAVLTLDGRTVTPTFVVATNSITVNYQPPTPFVTNSSHTVVLSVTDSNGTPYSTTWQFSVDAYPTLPVTIPGPIDVVYSLDGAAGMTICGVTNGWIANNYQASSTNTLYTHFSMEFFDLNGEVADDTGGCYGGLHFFDGGPENVGTERLLAGESWLRNTWSIDDKAGGEGGELNLPPTTVVAVGEYHTLAIKSVYSATGNATETVWLDPDFTKSEGNQPNAPLVVSMDNTFDTICLRCGNGSAADEFSNIVIAATSPFAVAIPAVLSLHGSGGNLNLSWTGAGTLQTAPAITGPWINFGNQANPQVITTGNSAAFFRLKQ
jgi:hypothetical protein